MGGRRRMQDELAFAAIVVWRDIGAFEEGVQMASDFAVTFAQTAAMPIGGVSAIMTSNSRSNRRW
jgi:hypothetical protein